MQKDDRIYRQALDLSFEYPVVFTRHLFDVSNDMLRNTLDQDEGTRPHRALFFVDEGVARKHADMTSRIEAYFTQHGDAIQLAMPPRIVRGGEVIKNDYRLTMEIVDTILECCLCRQSYVVAVGGGAVLDAVGFAASIVHRGLRLVRVPTTVLAQNDAGIGVKNGMNLHGGKNTIGTFSPPVAVLNDFSLLATLSDAQWIDGAAEAFKVAMIKDAAFFDYLCKHADQIRARDQDTIEQLIVRCAELHLEHIRKGGDPFELGTARPLDFGHWAAHKLECMSAYRISHGAAVATGIALDSAYALAMGWLDTPAFEALWEGLSRAGFALWHDELERREGDGRLEILNGLADFQEHLGGSLCVTFPRGIGQRHEVHEIDEALMEAGIFELKKRGVSGREASQRLSSSAKTQA